MSAAEQRTSDNGGTPRRRLGRYLLLDEIGRGGMGRVYSAYDPELDRKLAIKVLHKHGGASADEAQLRLLREAQALARLSHPNVVAIHDVGVHGGSVFLAMEYVHGQTLRRWAGLEHARDGERGSALRPWREVVAIFAQAGRGLAAAHEADLVHRDFKPDNVLVGEDGRVQVLDFGIARAGGNAPERAVDDRQTADGREHVDLAALDTALDTAGLESDEPESHERDEPGELVDPDVDTQSLISTGAGLLSSELTQVGARIGTPAYMAPEQHRGQIADARSDQFSFAVALYEALTGQRPFEGKTITALMMAIMRGQIREPPVDRKFPKWLMGVLVRALQADPEARWADMSAMLRELERDRQRGRRRWITAGSLLAASVLGAAWPILFAESPEDPCAEVGAPVDAAWNDAVEAQLHASFAATGHDYAPESARRVAAALDRYAGSLKLAREQSCRAEAPAEAACLDGLGGELEAVVEILASADDAVVQKAQDVVADLRPVDRCADEAGRAGTVAPPREDQADAVAAIARELIGVDVLSEAYESAEALTAAQAVLERARAVDYLPIQARAEAQVGKAQLRLVQYADAVASLEQGAWLARASGDDRLELELELLLITGLRLSGEFDRADRQIRRSEALALRVDPEGLLDADLRHQAARNHAERGAYALARDREREAIAIYEAHGLHDDPRLAQAVNGLSGALKQLGEYEQALAEAERALAIFEGLYGPEHPQVAGPLLSVGRVYRALGRLDQAEAAYLRAIDIIERGQGRDVARLGSYYNNLGNVYIDGGRMDDAEKAMKRSLEIREQEFGPAHVRTAYPLLNLGNIYLERGDYEAARPLLERGLAIREQAYDAHSRRLLDPLILVGWLEVETGDPERAIEHLERAEAIYASLPEAERDSEFPKLGGFWLGVALDAQTPGSARGRAYIEQAAEAYRLDPGDLDSERARVDAWLADHPAP